MKKKPFVQSARSKNKYHNFSEWKQQALKLGFVVEPHGDYYIATQNNTIKGSFVENSGDL